PYTTRFRSAPRPVLPAAVGPKVHPFPTWPPNPAPAADAGPEAGAATADRDSGRGPRTAVEAVRGLLAQGVTSPGEIQARSGYGETAVRQALAELTRQGRARRVRHGVWQLTEQEGS